MWRMLQHDEPDDYVLATGVGHTVREFVRDARSRTPAWTGRSTSRYDERYERPTEVDALIGDASKAREVLGWKAETNADRAGPAHGRRRHRADDPPAGQLSRSEWPRFAGLTTENVQ